MVLDEPLAEVVNEQREQHQPLPPDLPPGGPEPALVGREGVRLFDRHDAVLVHRVLVVVVELQQIAGVGELGDDPLEQSHVVQPTQGRTETPRLLEQRQEPGPRRLVDRVGMGRRGSPGGPHGLPRPAGDRQVVQHRQLDQTHDAFGPPCDLRRRVGQHRDLGGPDAEQAVDAVPDEAGEQLADGRRATHAPHQRLGDLGHPPRVAEILPHEPLDTEQPSLLVDPPGGRQPHLLVARQVVAGATGREMQVGADPGEEFAGIPQAVGIALGERPQMHEVVERRRVPAHATEPADELDVAQAARRPLHVGLQQGRGLTELLRLVASRGEQPVDQPAGAAARESPEPRLEPLQDVAVSLEQAALAQRTEDRRIAGGEAPGIGHGAHALPDLQTGVEQPLEQQPCRRGHGRLRRGLVQDHEIDVGEGGHLAPAVAAVGDERRLASKRARRRGHLRQDVAPDPRHDRVHQVGGQRPRLDARAAGGVLRRDPAA